MQRLRIPMASRLAAACLAVLAATPAAARADQAPGGQPDPATQSPGPASARPARVAPGELVGRPSPDFALAPIESGSGGRIKLSDRLAAGQGKRMVALFFWHPDCAPCRQAMPGIVAGWQAYGKYIDLISVAALNNESEAASAREAIRTHRMTFPALADEGRRVSDLYKVVSTPAMFFIRPDGRVESVYTNPDVNYVPVFSAKLRSILGVPSRLSGSRPKPKS